MHAQALKNRSIGDGRIRGLDGIRACAFLLVLAGHSGFNWVPNGLGVTIFFFLSGYLITTLLRQEWTKTGSLSVANFYIRRVFRILPPLFCAIALAVVLGLVGVIHSEVHWKAVVAVLLFLTNYAEVPLGLFVPAGLSVLWSLAVEEHFYLLFPLAYRGLLKAGLSRYRQAVFFGCLCLLILAWRTVLMTAFHTSWYRVYSGTDTRLDSILLGSIMAIAANPVLDRLEGLSRRRCAIIGCIGTVVLILTIAMRDEMFRQTARYTLQGVALFTIFIYIVRYSDSAITRVLELRILTHLGDLSYSLYVVHYTVLFVVKRWIESGPLVTLLLTFSISYVLAFMMRRYVELPSMKMRNLVLQWRRDRPHRLAVPTNP